MYSNNLGHDILVCKMAKLNINSYNNESKWYNKPFNDPLLFSEEKDFSPQNPAFKYTSCPHILRGAFSINLKFFVTLCLLNGSKKLLNTSQLHFDEEIISIFHASLMCYYLHDYTQNFISIKNCQCMTILPCKIC